MTRIYLEVAKFFGGDPIIAWTLTFALCFTIAAFVIVGRALYQERRQAREDADFRRRMSAFLGPVNYPPPKGPKGFENDCRHRRSA